MSYPKSTELGEPEASFIILDDFYRERAFFLSVPYGFVSKAKLCEKLFWSGGARVPIFLMINRLSKVKNFILMSDGFGRPAVSRF